MNVLKNLKHAINLGIKVSKIIKITFFKTSFTCVRHFIHAQTPLFDKEKESTQKN